MSSSSGTAVSLDRIAAVFWPQIRALLAAGLRAEDVSGILVDALSGMGYADVVELVDFTEQIEERCVSECCATSARGGAGQFGFGGLDREGEFAQER